MFQGYSSVGTKCTKIQTIYSLLNSHACGEIESHPDPVKQSFLACLRGDAGC